MGISGGTLTHHLNALEARGLVRRWRGPDNRRVQHTALTPAGYDCSSACGRSPRVSTTSRSRLTDDQTARLAELLDALEAGLQVENGM